MNASFTYIAGGSELSASIPTIQRIGFVEPDWRTSTDDLERDLDESHAVAGDALVTRRRRRRARSNGHRADRRGQTGRREETRHHHLPRYRNELSHQLSGKKLIRFTAEIKATKWTFFPEIILSVAFSELLLDKLQTFFTSSEMSAVLDAFCVYHVNAPGQAPGEEELPEDFAFPSMEELSEQVEYVLHYYGIANCVGFGVGFGANVLTRLAHRRPTMVDGLVLVNCNSTASGWLEWVYHKVNIKSLKKLTNSTNVVKLPEGVIEYLVWYHLGRVDTMAAMSLASILKQHFSCEVHPRNLCLLLQCFMQRTDLGLTREVAANGKPLFATSSRTLKTPVLNMTGDHSPHVDATVAFNGRLQPSKCTWMKFQDSAMVLEEQPAKVAEAVKLFLQGLGYVFKRSLQKSSVKSTPVLKRPEKPKEDNKETESDNKEQDLIDIQSQNKQVEVTN